MGRLASICLLLAAVGGLAAVGAGAPDDGGTIELVPAPPAPATGDLMRRWHRDTRGRLSPVLHEWELLARAARRGPGSELAAGCRRLDLALAELARERPIVAPDPSVALHLEETLRSLSGAAQSCAQGAYFLASWRLRQADASWLELRGRLLLYGLAP